MMKKNKQTKGKQKTSKKPSRGGTQSDEKPENTLDEDEHEHKPPVSKEPFSKEPMSKEPIQASKEKGGITAALNQTKKLLTGKKTVVKSKEKEKDKTSREKKMPSVSLPAAEKTERETNNGGQCQEKVIAAAKGLCRYLIDMKESSLSTYFDERLAKYTPTNCTFNEWEKNMSKNRSKEYKVSDASRVPIEVAGKPAYINASYIKLDPVCSEFILTQYPLKDTIHDFWRMVSQKKVNRIVTIFEPYVDEAIEEFNKVPSLVSPGPVTTPDSMNGPVINLSQKSQTREQIMSMSVRCETNQVKSSFFPLFTDHYMNLDNWLINTRKVEIDERNKNWMSLYTVEIVAEECSEANYIRVFNCTTWPWKKVPNEEKKLLALVRAPFKDESPLVAKQDKSEPIVVMCDLGLDRSATVVLTTVIIELVLAGKTPDCDALFKKMRDQRPNVFTMSIFYTYAIRSALQYLKMKLKIIHGTGVGAINPMITEALNKVPFVSKK
ncbi:unnamed protein product [Caenorhabditis brenneri]